MRTEVGHELPNDRPCLILPFRHILNFLKRHRPYKHQNTVLNGIAAHLEAVLNHVTAATKKSICLVFMAISVCTTPPSSLYWVGFPFSGSAIWRHRHNGSGIMSVCPGFLFLQQQWDSAAIDHQKLHILMIPCSACEVPRLVNNFFFAHFFQKVLADFWAICLFCPHPPSVLSCFAGFCTV